MFLCPKEIGVCDGNIDKIEGEFPASFVTVLIVFCNQSKEKTVDQAEEQLLEIAGGSKTSQSYLF